MFNFAAAAANYGADPRFDNPQPEPRIELNRRRAAPQVDLINVPPSSFLDDFKRLYDKVDCADVTLVVQDAEIHAHSLVLTCRSNYFRAMLSGEMRESHDNRIIVQDVSPGIMHRILWFIYSDELQGVDSVEEAFELHGKADMFQMERLKALVEHEIVQKFLSAESIMEVLRSCQSSNAAILKGLAMKFIGDNWDTVKESIRSFRVESLADGEILKEILLHSLQTRTTNGWQPGFGAPRRGCWQCRVCSVYNDRTARTCMACETPR